MRFNSPEIVLALMREETSSCKKVSTTVRGHHRCADTVHAPSSRLGNRERTSIQCPGRWTVISPTSSRLWCDSMDERNPRRRSEKYRLNPSKQSAASANKGSGLAPVKYIDPQKDAAGCNCNFPWVGKELAGRRTYWSCAGGASIASDLAYREARFEGRWAP